MASRACVLIFSLAAGLLPTAHDHAVADIQHVIPSYGVKLSLAIPGHVYSLNTLAPVQVRMQNVSHHPLEVVIACPPLRSPYAQVLDAQGWVVYPPAVPGAAKEKGCTGYRQKILTPRQEITRRVFVLLRTSRMRAVALVRHPGAPLRSYNMAMGKIGQVDLSGHEPPPTATITPQGQDVEVTVRSPVSTQGPLRYQYWYECDSSDGASTPQTYTWKSTEGETIHLSDPTCSQIVSWHVAAGWLDHPVATLDYTPVSSSRDRHG